MVGRPRKNPSESGGNDFDAVASSAETASSPKAAEIAKRNADAVRKAAKAVSVDSVVKDISGLGLDINRTLSGISEKITAKVNELAQLQQAVELERKALEELHGVDVVASTIAELVADYNIRKTQCEAEIANLQAKFSEERAALDKHYKELVEESRKTRQREEADFTYNRDQSRRRASDEFEDQMRAKARETATKQEALEKSWAAREEALGKRETEFADMSKQVAEFPETLRKEVAKAEAIASNSVKREYEVKMQLAAKDAESDKRSMAQEIASQRTLISQLEATINDLRNQLSDKSKQVQDIAVSAVNAASGRQALEALKDVSVAQSSTGTTKK